MLVLKRKVSEKIVIQVPPSDQIQVITIMVVESRPDSSRLGIQAPPKTAVHREEVLRDIIRKESGASPAAATLSESIPVRIWHKTPGHSRKSQSGEE